ncbi:unnamed protein product [Pieris macdunnoughi]|uniref:Uncharacterized protein n=1 Tax=Pieris macdunnoughi TaxID=345717 RepID=A0A821L871_9NEOP|nr:unnamed protein product [Pieris macdunnoughi]
MRSTRWLRCRPFSTRFLIISFLAIAFAIYCYYYNVTLASYPKSTLQRVSTPVVDFAELFPFTCYGYRYMIKKTVQTCSLINDFYLGLLSLTCLVSFIYNFSTF